MVQSKSDRERQKVINDKCQSLIEVLLKHEDNKYCVDCDSKGPRWASWNLGIFLCIRCAGIHRNLGVHISKVKSVNLDSWTPDHVAYMQRMGNSKARAVYEANLPDDFRRPQTDASLESFIRAKYEQKKYIAHGWIDPGPPAPAFSVEDEIKKIKEQKKNKLSGAISSSKMMAVSNILANPKPRPTDNSKLKDPTKNIPGLVDLKIVAATEAAVKNDNRASATNSLSNQKSIDLLNADLNFDCPDDPLTTSKSSVSLFGPNDNDTIKSSADIFQLEQTSDNGSQDKRKMLTKESILSLYSFSSSTSSNSDPFGMSNSLTRDSSVAQSGNTQPASVPYSLGNPKQANNTNLNLASSNSFSRQDGTSNFIQNSGKPSSQLGTSLFDLPPTSGYNLNTTNQQAFNLANQAVPANTKNISKIDELFSGLDILHNPSIKNSFVKSQQSSLQK